ncbi:MAG: hypothetical protein EBR86_01330 [Planctomycetia bacterium]|nr:hypothetical protein [Planctomycetia bacterium]
MDWAAVIDMVAGFVVALAAAVGIHRVRGTTAVPAAWWAVAAGVALAADGWATVPEDGAEAALTCRRLGVVAIGLCPGMSLLGAKRPQHGVWQAIVASLAVVILLPAASAVLIRPGSPPDVHLVTRCLVGALLLLGWLNHAATHRAIPVAGLVIGQMLLARTFLPGGAGVVIRGDALDMVAAVLLASAAAAAAAWPGSPRRKAGGARERSAASSFATLVAPAWEAFRETFGAAWTLRVAERFDAAAREHGWPCHLGWRGCEAGQGGPPDWPRDARRTFVALLRRFVTTAWLERHGLPPRGAPSTADAGPHGTPD